MFKIILNIFGISSSNEDKRVLLSNLFFKELKLGLGSIRDNFVGRF